MSTLPARLHLESANFAFETFTAEGIHQGYLDWLNDPEVNRYSRRRFAESTREDAEAFLGSLCPHEQVLAIRQKDGFHVGNIQFGPLDWHSRNAEIRILIGEKSVWGQGVGTEAIYTVTRFLFEELGLNRVEANSCNPAFIRCVEKLGWRREGCLRKRFLLDETYVDYFWFGILQNEFNRIKDLEPGNK